MTVQDLIDKLNKVENKSRLVIHYHDGWYPELKDGDLKELTLYTYDEGDNIVDYSTNRMGSIYEKIECFQVSYSG